MSGVVNPIDILPNRVLGHLIHDASIRVFPNPARDVIVVETPDYQIQQLSLYEASTGRLVQENQLGKSTMVLSQLSSGFYFLQIQTDQGIAFRPLILQD